MEKITEDHADFKTIEREIYGAMCEAARGITKEHLEKVDLAISESRDKTKYREVGIRATAVKTIYGEVSYSRRYYKGSDGKYVFLLDEAMGIGRGYGLVSENLAERIVIECSEKPFRKAAATISAATGQAISAMGAWGVAQRCGEAIGRQKTRFAELDAAGSCGHLGNLASPVVFEEFDDVWLPMQKDKRAVRKAGGDAGAAGKPGERIGKKPMHVGIAYTGWAESADGSFSTADKIACASFGSASEFASTFEALLRNRFDMDGVERRLTNGDGAAWIRTAAEEHDSILNLDTFHRSQAVIRAVGDADGRKQVFDAIAGKDADKILETIDGLRQGASDEHDRKKIGDLYGYFNNNKDILLTYAERGIELPPPPDGVVYRDMGAQESNNCSLITLRMKNRKASWSERGGNHMADILCLRNTIGLDLILGALPESGPPQAGPLSAAKAPARDGRGYDAWWLRAEMPFEGAAKTNGREAIRGVLKMQPFSQLSFM